MLRPLFFIAIPVFFVWEVAHATSLDDWQYRIVAETGDQFQSFSRQPIISCDGDVAFVATTAEGSGVYKVIGETIYQLHHHGSGAEAYNQPAITASGDVVFLFTQTDHLNIHDSHAGSLRVLYQGNEKELKEAFGNSHKKQVTNFAVNNQGTIVYAGIYQKKNSAQNSLFVFDGKQSKLVVDKAEHLFIEFGNNGVAINDNGQVVFAGTRLDRSSGVFVVSLNGVLAIADKSTGIDHYLHPIINNAGDVAVFGYVKIDERRSRMGIYLIKDGTITQIGGDAYKMVSTTIHNVAAATGRVRNGVYLK